MDRHIVTVSRHIAAPAQALFNLVANPAMHPVIDGSGSVRKASSVAPQRLSLGARFGMSMRIGAPYRTHSTVVEFEEGRRIAWRVGASGTIWRYTFEPDDTGPEPATVVTEQWDVRGAPLRRALVAAGFGRRAERGIAKTLALLGSHTDSPPAPARELVAPVALTTDSGLLNPASVGWARQPLVDTGGIGRGPRRAFGRTKRWEYWNVITPTHVVSLTVSSIDYAAVHEIWLLDRASGRTWGAPFTLIPARGVRLLPRWGDGVTMATAPGFSAEISTDGPRTRLVGVGAGVQFEIEVHRPANHDCLAVVVPWSARRFQYTVKDVALPASGWIEVDGLRHEVQVGRSWAVLDHGRGRWPYRAAWNWGAASGRLDDGRSIGIQVGATWTDGTGQTENGVLLDGTLHKIHAAVAFDFDAGSPTAPWRIHGGGLAATMTPFHLKRSSTNFLLVSSKTDQAFGTWAGTFTPVGGKPIPFEGLVGFAEDVHNRW